ncbi:MAG: HAD hydrolase-like protein [Opitutales bacterium]|nr:HAD hydrolase-like protein [Opitutales bacterium]MCH8540146.1 HAD family hydrolase [Opitutales bacterium]
MTQTFANTPSPRYILLWDIDGTLISGGGAGERALEKTGQEFLHQHIPLHSIDYHGRTDRRISRMLFEHTGRQPTEDQVAAFASRYLEKLRHEITVSPEAHVKPGIRKILPLIDQHPKLAQGLLTGNLPEGARIKLEHFDLWAFFPFGAFADHAEERNELAPHALRLTRQHISPDFPPERLIVIGDTPHDITCGKHIRALTVAVATGHYSLRQLQEATPDAAFSNLEPISIFFDWLTQHTGTRIVS